VTIRKFALASLLLLAASPSALAQTASPPAQKPSPAAPSSASPSWYAHQPDEMRASKLIGTKVVNAANETVGDINEIVLGKDGKVAAVVIGVGGFLGMGEREVAMNFQSLRISKDANNKLVLTVDATKDSLKDAPAWRWEDTAKR
jgi:sporulation protein YlmC with PRC-barrel domain